MIDPKNYPIFRLGVEEFVELPRTMEPTQIVNTIRNKYKGLLRVTFEHKFYFVTDIQALPFFVETKSVNPEFINEDV
ncbi:hypothetical protein LPJ60_006307, partial [Coemansia sp. RSA 2675]